MALLLICGFEAGIVALPHGMTPPQNLAIVTGRDGVGKGISAGGVAGSLSVPLPVVSSGHCVVGFGFWSSAGIQTVVLRMYSEAGSRPHIELYKDPDGRIHVERNGSVLATSASPVVTSSTWCYIEIKGIVADAGGRIVVKVNGVQVIDFTGDTKNGGVVSDAIDFLSFTFSTSSGTRLDDVYVLDGSGPAPYNDFIGEKVIKAKRLVGNGASSQFLGSDGDSIDNYQLTDEDPLNITDYVASNTSGHRDLYDLAAATGLASVDGVQVFAYGSKSDSGARSIKTLVRSSGGTVDASAALPLSTTWGIVQALPKVLNPDGVAWTPVSINAIQAGIEVV